MQILLCLLLCFVKWSSAAFPNPQKEPAKCGRNAPSFVCDPDLILDNGQAVRLHRIAVEFQESTSCVCTDCSKDLGVSVGIMLKNSVPEELLRQNDGGKGLTDMIRKKWRLSDCESDMQILLIIEQNITEFSMGYPVQRLISLKVANRIVSDCWGHIQSGYYYQGLESILNSFNDVLVGLQRKEKNTEDYKNIIVGVALGLAVLVFLVLAAFTFLHRQAKRRKSYCSTIYDPPKPDKKKNSLTREEQLEVLRKLNEEEDDDEDSDFVLQENSSKPLHHSTHALRSVKFDRQLSDVTEESPEDMEMLKKNSSGHSSFSSSHLRSSSINVPVTEL